MSKVIAKINAGDYGYGLGFKYGEFEDDLAQEFGITNKHVASLLLNKACDYVGSGRKELVYEWYADLADIYKSILETHNIQL